MGWGSGSGKAEVLKAVSDPIVAFSSSDDHPFNGKLVFIDVSGLAHKASKKDAATIVREGTSCTQPDYMRLQIRSVAAEGGTPVLVLDGRAYPPKLATCDARRKAAAAARVEAERLQQLGHRDEARKQWAKAADADLANHITHDQSYRYSSTHVNELRALCSGFRHGQVALFARRAYGTLVAPPEACEADEAGSVCGSEDGASTGRDDAGGRMCRLLLNRLSPPIKGERSDRQGLGTDRRLCLSVVLDSSVSIFVLCDAGRRHVFVPVRT